MKLTLDSLLVAGMVLCYGLGHLFAADSFVQAAALLLLVFVVRMLGSALNWVIRGR